MSYAIIRNVNYKKENLAGAYKHNERKNTNYSNKNIHREKSLYNYSIKECNTTYWKRFNEIKERYNLKSRITSYTNLMCEFIITSDDSFFKTIGEEETRRYFETAYRFVAGYQNLGEEFIISAKVHMDESTPHMHIVFIPVVHKVDKKTGEVIGKIACSEYWKGKDSYSRLQDNFYNYMTRAGFYLDRGKERENEHIPIEKLKKITNYEMQEMFEETKTEEKEVISDNPVVIKEHYRIVLKKFNTIAKRYVRVKNIVDDTLYKAEQVEQENKRLNQEINYLEHEKSKLEEYIENTFEVVKHLFNFPIESLKRIVNNFMKER